MEVEISKKIRFIIGGGIAFLGIIIFFQERYALPFWVRDIPFSSRGDLEFNRRVLERYAQFKNESELKSALEKDGFRPGLHSADVEGKFIFKNYLRPPSEGYGGWEISWDVSRSNQVINLKGKFYLTVQ